MTRKDTRRWAAVTTIALIALTPASPSNAAQPTCGSTLSPSEITSVGSSCKLAAATVVSVAPGLDVVVPEPGVAATAAVLRTQQSTAPSLATVYRTSDDKLALRIDDEPAVGSAPAAAALDRIRAKRPEATGTTGARPLAAAAAAPAWCGETWHWQAGNGVWRYPSQYPWTYNPHGQPAADALSAIQYGFKFITDDSSSCGSAPTYASASYRGTTTRYTWGTRDNGNVAGWAGFDLNILARAYTWTDHAGYRLEGDIAFNNRRSDWFTGLGGTIPTDRIDLISVATHEAGHIFGLNHFEGASSQVMSPTFSQGENRRTKRSGDLRGINYLYS
ncbi:matrixin family metalloprotease [Plantactinospora sp. GCM10030261]|uniref:matrixin family metalloprotease n=1 Tax=Plantactinospora sp. GCM10030261 TaxID=3273420 RepID=UPI003612163B